MVFFTNQVQADRALSKFKDILNSFEDRLREMCPQLGQQDETSECDEFQQALTDCIETIIEINHLTSSCVMPIGCDDKFIFLMSQLPTASLTGGKRFIIVFSCNNHPKSRTFSEK